MLQPRCNPISIRRCSAGSFPCTQPMLQSTSPLPPCCHVFRHAQRCTFPGSRSYLVHNPRNTTVCLAGDLLQQDGTAAAAALTHISLPSAISSLPTSLGQAAQWLLTGMAAYVAAGWPERPRGWSRRDLIEVIQSQVQGLGVVAKAAIPEGTVVGCYPGRPRQAPDMKAKIDMAPLAASYCFQTRAGWLLDPTDLAGRPTPRPSPGLPWLAVDETLCRVNEPPRGSGGPNVEVQDDPKDALGLVVVASRAIKAGEELWIDYGPVYDRSMYGEQQRRQQEQ